MSVDVDTLEQYRHWKPEVQAKALAMLEERAKSEWKPFYCKNRTCTGAPHIIAPDGAPCIEDRPAHRFEEIEPGTFACAVCATGGVAVDSWTFRHARPDQRPPAWQEEWLTWLLRGGRGSGKTRTGSEVAIRATKIAPRIALVAATGSALRATMIEGESGILACAPPDQRPEWYPTRKLLKFPNGAEMQGFSAEEPDRLRGPQHHFAWLDEPGHFPLIEEVWYNLLMGLRLGKNPKIVATSTPKPTKWLKELLADPLTIDTRVSTMANIDNLAPTFQRTVISRFANTRLGRQELEGELLEDVEGALWNNGIIEHVDDLPEDSFERIVVAVDPAGTANAKSDETGIVVVARLNGHFYVLADYTGKYSPDGWASEVHKRARQFRADAIVVERTYGQDMVKRVMETSSYKSDARLITVDSRRGKALRAEPVVALYEQGRVFHTGERGVLVKLEEEMTQWVPGKGASPNRVDALVHGLTELNQGAQVVTVASPAALTQSRRAPASAYLGPRRGVRRTPAILRRR